MSTALFPITADRGPVGSLLAKWAAEGTAAGNVGDLYDNRDRGHSLLNLKNYPQLRQVSYSVEDRNRNRDWALQAEVLPGVVFGNSSTASSATVGGSNTRMMYVAREGLEALHRQYRRNNLYIYPAHQDYRPGRNGVGGGWGDLLPTNSPYLITSLGSSGSDQPFMQAVAATLAAFRPEVKRKLVEEGMLMPTVQMILRLCSRQVQTPEDYLTGKAHPAVFDGKQVDALKMVQLAHGITLDCIPPLAQVTLLEEQQAPAGVDYFDPMPETLAATPGAIARVYRGMAGVQRLVVSAALSKDFNDRPLTYRWVLLRGDAEKVQVVPREDGRSAEIWFRYHPRTGTLAGVEGNRVEVGLFVHNGVYYSAPAFVTSFTLDSEVRTYDSAGRVVDVGYDVPVPAVAIKDFGALFAALEQGEGEGRGAVKLLCEAIGEPKMAAVRVAGKEYAEAADRLVEVQKGVEKLEQAAKAPGRGGADTQALLASARTVVAKAKEAREEVLDGVEPSLGQSVRQLLIDKLSGMVADPAWYVGHQKEVGTLAGPAAERMQALARWEVLEKRDDGYAFTAKMGGRSLAVRPTNCERAMLGGLNAAVLAAQVPGVSDESRPGVVDSRLTLPKGWRDVYQYSDTGQMVGWRRHGRDGKAMDYNARGEVVVERDGQGRPTVTRNVVYQGNAGGKTPLMVTLGDRYSVWAYRDGGDWVGKVARVEHR